MPPRAKRPTPPARDTGATIAGIAISAAFAASAFLVDPRAEASFDAPKRLATLIAVGIAAAAAFLWGRHGSALSTIWRSAGRLPRAVLVLAAAALAGAAVSALASPRRAMALDGFR